MDRISEKSKCGVSMIPGCYYAAEESFFLFPFPPLNGVLSLCSPVNSRSGFGPSTFCFLIPSQGSLRCGAFSALLLSFPLSRSLYPRFNSFPLTEPVQRQTPPFRWGFRPEEAEGFVHGGPSPSRSPRRKEGLRAAEAESV